MANTSQAIDDTLLSTLGIDDAGPSGSGAGVGVAIIDSGFDPAAHNDFHSSAVTFFDFTSTSPAPVQTSRPYDDYGHGTHLAGLIASDGDGSKGLYRGIAPGHVSLS